MRYRDDLTPKQAAQLLAEADALDKSHADAAAYDAAHAPAMDGAPCPEDGLPCGNCPDCAENYESEDPVALGWVGRDGQP